MQHQANTDKQHLLLQATEKFTALTGVPLRIATYEHPIGRGRIIDALVHIGGVTGANTYAVEMKRYLTMAKLGLAAEQLKDAPYKGMLVTDYVNPNMADRLKEMDLAFIDLAGNAYLNEPPIFVYMKGNRPLEKKLLGATQKPTRAFQPTGLKMLFGLLTNPELLNEPYRDIAEATGVALGTVGWVFTEMREHGLVFEGKGRERRLTQKRRLLEEWVTAYPDKLRPKLRLGRYTAPTHHWWEKVNLEPRKAQWGGEVAAGMVTNYLKPEKAVIYADTIPARLIVENQLKTDPDGDVEILQRFWKPQHVRQTTNQPNVPADIVPPLLIYADLMATADDRNVETAKMIYEKFLHGHFE
jgi:hypothetical protein